MGRGDKKSRKGKIFRGSYGIARPRKTDTVILTPSKKKAAPEKAVTKKKITAKTK